MAKKKKEVKEIEKKVKKTGTKAKIKSKKVESNSKSRFKFLRKLKKKHVIGGFILFTTAILLWLFWGIPLTGNISDSPVVSTKIFDRNQNLIYEIFADKKRSPIPLEEIPLHVQQATIAIEDKDFYNHPGFDLTGISRAAFRTLTNQRLEGGSTLTQQLVKVSLLTPDRTIKRKIQELALALVTEIRYSKDEILELYLNQIPYGSTAYGIDAAADLYFNKSARDLNLSEASLLAGITAAPTRFSPFGARPELAKGRQEAVLRRMVEDGYITQEEADSALAQELQFAEVEAPVAPHFSFWIREILAEEYGETVVEQGGLRVTTTLDLELQEFAQNAVAEEVASLEDNNVGNGAAIVTKPGTGEILAMVGSKDYFATDEDGKVNIIFANRQPGSSIKPLNYALAIKDKKVTPATIMADIPTCFSVIGQAPYCPVNYDGSFHGAVSIRDSLGNSFNIPAVRVLALNGVENFINFSRDLGITTFDDPSRYGLSLTLGGGEVKPYDMAVAFGVFANNGIKQPLTPILKVENWKGEVLQEVEVEELSGDRILDAAVPFIITNILGDNSARLQAFGGSSLLNVAGYPNIAVKTGTTNDRRDNWTVGYNKNILALTWVGNNDNTPMSGAVSGVSGASPIWNQIMKKSLDMIDEGKLYPDETEPNPTPIRPDNVVGISVCGNTGGAFVEGVECPSRFDYFLQDNLPSQSVSRQDIPIDRVLQQIANQDTPPENIEVQNHLVISDPLGTPICLDCSFPLPSVTVRYPL